MSAQTQPQPPRVKKIGFLSALISFVFNASLAALAGGLMLSIEFACEAFFKGIQTALQHSESLMALYAPYGVQVSFLPLQNSLNVMTAFTAQFHHLGFMLALSVIKLFLMRLKVFFLFVPLFLMILTLFIIDGCVLRDIRKFQAKRESSLLFHRLKLGLNAECMLIFFIYFSLPFFVSPLIFLVSQIVVFSFMARLSVTYFKKYL